MDFLYSDEGQNIWLKGYCHPIRYEDLVAGGRVPQEQLDKLPDVTGAVFPTLDQLNAAKELITTQWDTRRRRRRRRSGPLIRPSSRLTSDDHRGGAARRRRLRSHARTRSRSVWAWVGVLPFFLFALLFIGFPAMFLVVGSLIVEETGSVGLDNYAGLTGPCCAVAFRNSIQLSLITAIVGAIFGLLLAAAVILGGLPAVPALGPHDLLRRREQLRGHPARPRVHLHPGQPRPASRSCSTTSSASRFATPASRSTR